MNERVRYRGAHRCLEYLHLFGTEDLVEAECELATAVTDKRPGLFEAVGVVRAAWVAHGLVGLVVMPAKNTSRLVMSMKNSR